MNKSSSWILCGSILVVALGLAVFFHLNQNEDSIRPDFFPQDIKPNADPNSLLMKTDKKNLYSALSEKDKIRIRRAVQYFCEIQWHEDSCLSHMITCGKKCGTYLKPETQRKVKKAYYRRLAQINQ